jgi:hypothetical protein
MLMISRICLEKGISLAWRMVYLTILYLQYNQSLYFYFWLLWLSRLFDCSCQYNKKRENDLTIAVGVGDIAGSMYGSYEGVFPSLYKLEQV